MFSKHDTKLFGVTLFKCTQCNIHPERERERERVTYTEEAFILRKPFLILVKLQLVSDLWRDNNN